MSKTDQPDGFSFADTVPWSDKVSAYDHRHREIYLRLLDAEMAEVSAYDMARRILDINPEKEPERARRSVESHLIRAKWMTEFGFRQLLANASAHEF